ncbi:hypothetical protein [Streptomyces sp. HUAS TT3]|uniref:hypothetical protein n=1 Tax=Streptomyces sp. HUAS TT3 TaxID=3447510 RepID=UPI003F65BB96
MAAACPAPVLPGVPALGPEFSCGYLTVPENRAEPDGRTIRIAVARLRAAAAQPRPDPVVWPTGGPGGSGLLDALTVTRLKPAIAPDACQVRQQPTDRRRVVVGVARQPGEAYEGRARWPPGA